MKRTSRKGFTLIELIVTIVILGILAALAVPAFQAVIERSRKNAVAQAGNSVAREMHALAAFDADFAGDLAAWDTVLTEAKDAEDIPTSLDTVVNEQVPESAAGAGDAYVGLLVEEGIYEVVVNLGTNPGTFTSVDTGDVKAVGTAGAIG